MTALAVLALATPYFGIKVVDAATGRGVPLVELRTVNSLTFVTDSNGFVAFNEPGLMDRKVYFHLRGHGYELPKDGFDYRGVALTPRAGGREAVRVTRINIAERIARLTGSGIFRDSRLLGEKAPELEERLLGQDTAQAEIYRGRMMWFWGDTDRASYPLGNFHTTGAVASLPKGGPSQGIRYRYFADDDFVREMAPSKEPGPVWISGLVVLGKGADERLFAYYARMKSLGEIAESGLLRWNDAREAFDPVRRFDKAREWRFLDGHTIREKHHLIGNFPPNVRVPADEKSLLDAGDYEAFTCLQSDGGLGPYRWQKARPPITPAAEAKLIADGKIRPEEAHFLPKDAAGETIMPHGGSVHWNAFRKRWVAIFTRVGGKDSHLGEIYYSEAEAPTGPFRRAVKVITHDRYTFYNPVHHAFLDENGGRTIYFEGTYTAEFSGNPEKTPLYNYNQILYRLDLDDGCLTFARTQGT